MADLSQRDRGDVLRSGRTQKPNQPLPLYRCPMKTLNKVLTACCLVLIFVLGRLTSEVFTLSAQGATPSESSEEREAAAAEPEADSSDLPVIQVATLDEFLNAIGSDRIVEITEPKLVLTANI